MRAAYLVQAHRDPEQVTRLLGTLRRGSPDAALLLHYDPRGPAFTPPPEVQLVPAKPVVWGWTSQLEAMLRSFRWALQHVEFDWLFVLSGQDYPLRPLAAIEGDLAGDGYVEGAPVGARDDDEFARRYFFRYRIVRRTPPKRAIIAARSLLALREMPWGTLLGHRVSGPPIPVRRGSDWLTLSRRAVEVVARGDHVEHFARTIIPTEAYPQSVLYAADLALTGDPRRYSVWAPGAAHPSTLGLDDVERALASGADFGRKFEDPRVLDVIDRAVLA